VPWDKHVSQLSILETTVNEQQMKEETKLIMGPESLQALLNLSGQD